MSDSSRQQDWDLVLQPTRSLFDLKFKEIRQYRDLLLLMVRRDIVTIYKQTVLGPVWIVIQPVLTTLVFTVVFGNVAKISTDGLPKILFYLSGVTIWQYFAESLRLNSEVFRKNQQLFGRVYFPRAIMPLSVVVSNLVKLAIQIILFLGFYGYFLMQGAPIQPQPELVFLPLMILIMALLSLGLGLMISSLTAKYRDISFLVRFGVQLFMYATPVVYPASLVTGRYEILFWLNPITSVVEAFRFSFLGQGIFSWPYLIYSLVFAIVAFVMGLAIFNRTEKNFMDTV